jgi:ribosomal protein S6E (S10)
VRCCQACANQLNYRGDRDRERAERKRARKEAKREKKRHKRRLRESQIGSAGSRSEEERGIAIDEMGEAAWTRETGGVEITGKSARARVDEEAKGQSRRVSVGGSHVASAEIHASSDKVRQMSGEHPAAARERVGREDEEGEHLLDELFP